GYCMFDGWFAAMNYFETNRQKGGACFTQCLFNPQLDVYAFSKHYRDSLTPVLTWPPELHRYHRDGFPVILAFRSGRQVAGLPEGSLYPYDSTFEKLKMILWNDSTLRFKPVSDLQFATRIIYENMRYSAVCIVADGNQAGFENNSEFAGRARCFSVKFLSRVSPGDLKLNVLLEGRFPREVYRLITGGKSPFRLESDSVLGFGGYRFGVDSIGISASIPNPLNPEKYTVIKIRGRDVEKGFFDNSVDYSIYAFNRKTNSTRILLHGFFVKQPGNPWRFSDSLCISHLPGRENCVGVCNIPGRRISEHPASIPKPIWRRSSQAEEFTFGKGSCRFPSLAADNTGTVWVCWEEKGDILLSSADRDHPVSMAVEHDRSDSYNPLVAYSGGKLWVFYLNNRDGFYRVYMRCFDGSGLTGPVLCTELLPCDAVTPAVVATEHGVVLAWSYWKSNFRYPFYRNILNGIPDSIHSLPAAKCSSLPGYLNSWGFSLDTDSSGRVWGAWNQHYPATLGVCAGYLAREATSVTRVSGNMEECENGGYPSALHDNTGLRRIFWESFGWEVAGGGRQKIFTSVFDPATGRWSPSAALPGDEKTIFNQTPQAATSPDGRVYVTWSGRSKEGNWTLYLSTLDHNTWSIPVKLTSGKEPARAPKIISTEKNGIFIACHYGTGPHMKIKVFRIPLKQASTLPATAR
ncbi:MAG: hypothetical protein WCK34_06955, partial [Bacteroidota bacterium]